MKKVFLSFFIGILLVGSLFAQVGPAGGAPMSQVQNQDPLNQMVQDQERLQERIFFQDVSPVTITGTVKTIVDNDVFLTLSVEVDSEIYSVRVPKNFLDDVKAGESIELTGYKVVINDIKNFVPLEIKYQDRTVNMQRYMENVRSQNFEERYQEDFQQNQDYQRYRDYQDYQDYQDFKRYQQYKNYQDYQDFQRYQNYQRFNQQRYQDCPYYND
ncbi:hypothetical protein X925_02595 [Petrotoga sp. 9T1HF07.CasAA.8.2]|uniref:hypothetical protein n=1 Tax=Petrotoga sp. 9T1HF07.CasAA.8.2 TaxID=1434329 RepID=UPI000CB12347|nr:hypothetical protein [Petrotoga sp. 9T1HF07.CasAA.8.2]PNR89540.1 hypothetical protein X925_02595 [Petrotoga sp. 9T1HF07.CasAA.8.2]